MKWLSSQDETVKVKFVYNRLVGENGGGQIKYRTTSKKARAAPEVWCNIDPNDSFLLWG